MPDGLTGRESYKAILLKDRLQAEVVDRPRWSDKVVDFGHFGYQVAGIRLVSRVPGGLPADHEAGPSDWRLPSGWWSWYLLIRGRLCS